MSSKTLTDIACTVRQIRDKAIAVADGTTEEHTDQRTGEVTERERWFWWPKSVIEVDPSDYDVGDTVTITVPEAMAIEKEML